MTKLDKQLAALREMLLRCGFEEDRYGHFQKDTTAKTLSGADVPAKMRVKIQKISVLVELKKDIPRAEWRKIESVYMKDVTFTDKYVTIGRRSFKAMW